MILLNLLIFLIKSKSHDTPLLKVIPGEWDVVVSSEISRKSVFSPYSAEFHINPLTSSLYGSIWANSNSSDSFLDLEDAELAQLEIDFKTPASGSIFNLKPQKTLMTQFEFKPSNFGMMLVTRGKINNEYSFQITLTNDTLIQVFIMSSKSTKVSEFYAIKMPKPTTSSPYSRQFKIIGLIFVSLILIQISIWLLIKCCKSRLEDKIAQQQENTIIDLDKYSEYLKEQEKMKKE